MEVRKFCLYDVKGPVCTTWKVTIHPFSTVNVHANSSIKGHWMWVHVLTELVPSPQLPATVVPTATYGELHPRSSRVPICLCNLSAHTMEIPAKAVIGQVDPANQVLLVVHPTRTFKELHNKSQNEWFLEALDLQGLKEWPESEQKQARELLLKWDVKAHIHKMLDTCAICKLHSPWASMVVLVWNKDSSLRFCIDLRMLNNWTVKDAYSLPHIHETSDSLQGSQWFSSLDLKSGY